MIRWAILVSVCLSGAGPQDGKIKVLILDGQNNHDFASTTDAVKATLERTGRFDVTVSRSPGDKAPKEEWQKWRPDFASCRAVLSNYNGQMWPDEVREAFVKFVRDGGGAVFIHAANNAFTGWAEYEKMAGLCWRDAAYAERLTLDDKTGKQIRTPKGEGPGGGHGKQHSFVVKGREPEHPIMKGMPSEWKHATDELYHGQRGPAADMTVLLSAFSDPGTGGTGAHEALVWIIPYGKGRVVTNVLGHHWRGQKDFDALHCVGFQALVARSVEWAATEKVTIALPDAFPTADKISVAEPAAVHWGK